MKSLAVCVVTFMPFLVNGQGNYGFGYVLTNGSRGPDSISRTIFVTEVVDLDSLLGQDKNSSIRFSKNKLRKYHTAMKNWVLEMIKQQRPGIAENELEIYNQIELHPGLSLQTEATRKLNKRLGVKLKRSFMIKIKAARCRVIMIDAAKR
jgi:hypothetical protein